MLKKIIFFCVSLAFGAGLYAQTQTDATISASKVKYWVGNGCHNVVVAVNFGDPDTCIAWGYRFNTDSVIVSDMMDSIMAYDSRLLFSHGNNLISDIKFVSAANDTFKLGTSAQSYWMYNLNGSLANWGIDLQNVVDGDLVKFGDAGVAIVDQTNWTYTWTTPITAVNVPAFDYISDAMICSPNIKYWIGNGTNEVIMAVNWANPDTCVAWGYRFSTDSVLVSDMMNDIANADYRFSFDSSMGSWGPVLNDIFFVKGPADTLKLAGMWWSYNINGAMAQLGFGSQYVKDGDFVKWGDESVAHVNDTDSWGYPSDVAWTAPVIPVYAPDAMIDASQITYWVGSGSNEVILAVNWANPDTCLAWGYRFSTSTVTVAKVISDIAAADNRFSYDSSMSGYGAYMNDIQFVASANDTFKLSGMYWMYNINGFGAMLGFDAQQVSDGDFIKFGDESAGTITDPVMYSYIWTTNVTPVTAPSQQGIVAADGSINFSVYPNPASSKINVVVENAEATQIILMDASGRTVKTIATEGAENHTIDISDLQAGIYFVNVRNENVSKVSKLIVK